MRRQTFILLSLVIICGAVLRVWQIERAPYWMDEGYTINAVLSIQEKGVSVLDSGKSYNCPMYCYPTARIAELLGDRPMSYRIFAVVAGVLLIPLVYVVTRRFFEYKVSIVSSIAISLSYWQIAWSRQARWYTLFALFVWIAIYFYYRALYDTRHRTWSIIVSILATIFAIQTHALGYVLPFFFVFWYVYDQLFIAKKWRIKAFMTALGIALVSLFILVFVFRSTTLAVLFSRITFAYELPYYLSFYLRSYWLFIVFAVFGFSVAHEHKKVSAYLLTLFLAYLIPLSFLTQIVHYRYLFAVTPVLLILGAYGMVYVSNLLHTHTKRALYWGALALVFVTVGGGVFIPQSLYLLEADNPDTVGTRPHYAYTPQPDWNSAYDFIRNNRSSGDITISSMPQFTKIFLHEPGYWLAYDYLGFGDAPTLVDGREYYVNAIALTDLRMLTAQMGTSHGYLILDTMAYGKVSPDVAAFVEGLPQVFHERTNSYSEVWVYRF